MHKGTFNNLDAEIYYEVYGNGFPLVLIAGLGSDSQSWLPLIPLLQEEYQIIVFDNRAVGRTVDDGTPLTVQQMAHDVTALLDHLEIPTAHIAGHSMGGMIAQLCAAEYPERVNKLILAATAAAPFQRDIVLIRDWAETQEHLSPAEWFRNILYWILTPRFFENKTLAQQTLDYIIAYPYPQKPEDFLRQVNAICQTDTTPCLPCISADTLLLQGQQDILFPPQNHTTPFRSIPSLTIREIENAAHSIHLEQAKPFAETIKIFLHS